MSADPESRVPTSGQDPTTDGPTGPGGVEPGAGEGGASPGGFEPDVRFTYANERTFLAWNRTALALIATGVAATQLLPEFQVAYGRRILGVPLIALGALVAVTSFRQWRANERAMRLRRPLPRSSMTTVLSIGIAVVAVIAVVLVLLGTK
jgi:putative membrane protein